jgi:hypothetical protein
LEASLSSHLLDASFSYQLGLAFAALDDASSFLLYGSRCLESLRGRLEGFPFLFELELESGRSTQKVQEMIFYFSDIFK